MHISGVDASYATWLFWDKNILTNLIVAYNYWDCRKIWLMNCSPGYLQHKTMSARLSIIWFQRAYDETKETSIIEIIHLVYVMPSDQEFCWEIKKYKWESRLYLLHLFFFNANLLKRWIPDKFLLFPLCTLILFCIFVYLFLSGRGFWWVWFSGGFLLGAFFNTWCSAEEKIIIHPCYLSHVTKGSAFQTRNTCNGTILYKEIIFQAATQKWQELWKCSVEGVKSWATQKTCPCSNRNKTILLWNLIPNTDTMCAGFYL